MLGEGIAGPRHVHLRPLVCPPDGCKTLCSSRNPAAALHLFMLSFCMKNAAAAFNFGPVLLSCFMGCCKKCQDTELS